mmetsp:Transcript_6077/g.14717  ORF Transcript_6077/g.14717 Transcript_6077/m.14717 type:complete len:709 (-) Transcript_6077:78-2204(-)
MSPSESASSRDDSGGFQRGFLLDKATRAKGSKGRVQSRKPSKSSPLNSPGATSISEKKTASSQRLAASQPIAESATSAVKSRQSHTYKVQQNPQVARAPNKKDSGLTKGFLRNKPEKKATATAVGKIHKKDNYGAKSTVRSPVAVPSKGKDSGWTKGFLTNKKTNKKDKKIKDETTIKFVDNTHDSKVVTGQKDQPSPTRNDRKAARSSTSNILLSIDDNVDDRCSRNSAPMIVPAKQSAMTALSCNWKPLISVVFDEITNEMDSSPDVPHPLQRGEVTGDRGKSGVEGNTESSTTNFVTKSLITPLISIMKEDKDCEEEEASSIFVKEVSTTRKLDHRRGDLDKSQGVTEEEHSFSPLTIYALKTENVISESFHSNSTIGSTSGSTDASPPNYEEENGTASSLGNGDKSNDNENILGLQQELEHLFLRAPKVPQWKEHSDQHEYDYSQALIAQLKTPEHRRYAWMYLLQQRQQEQYRQKYRIQSRSERNDCDLRIRALFNVQFFYHRQKCNEAITNIDSESPLESILRCVDTELDRSMALQSVLVIQEYFVFLYKEHDRHQQHDTPKRVVFNAKEECIQRIEPLFVCLTRLSSEKRRTWLVQTAWETAILLFCFCIRECWGLRPPSLSPSCASLAIFGEKLDTLLHQQLIWQESKTKLNAAKIFQLKKIRTKSKNIFEDRKSQQDGLNSSSALLREFVLDLGTLIDL